MYYEKDDSDHFNGKKNALDLILNASVVIILIYCFTI